MHNNNRPKFLNLLKIRLPVTGVTSILHRISGIFLFVTIPFSLYLLQLSVHDTAGFALAKAFFASPWVKLGLLVLLWSYLHHLFAGFRFLLIDQNIGTSLAVARKSAWTVLFLAIFTAVVIAGSTLL